MGTWATEEERHEQFVALTPDCPLCGANPCYRLCPNSPHYYSPEREREDTLRSDAMSHDEWFREAVAQYERVRGEPYVS